MHSGILRHRPCAGWRRRCRGDVEPSGGRSCRSPADLVVSGDPASVYARAARANDAAKTRASSSASAIPFSTSLLMPRPTDTMKSRPIRSTSFFATFTVSVTSVLISLAASSRTRMQNLRRSSCTRASSSRRANRRHRGTEARHDGGHQVTTEGGTRHLQVCDPRDAARG